MIRTKLLTKTFLKYLVYRILNIVFLIFAFQFLLLTKGENYVFAYMFFILSIIFFLQYSLFEPKPIFLKCLEASGYIVKNFISFTLVCSLSYVIFLLIYGLNNLKISILNSITFCLILLVSGIVLYFLQCNKNVNKT